MEELPRSEYHKSCKNAPEATPGSSEAFVCAVRTHVRSLQERLGPHESHLLPSLEGPTFDDGYLGLLLTLLGPRLRWLDFSESLGEHRRRGGHRILHDRSARWVSFLMAWPQNFLSDSPVPVLCAFLKRLTVRRIGIPGIKLPQGLKEIRLMNLQCSTRHMDGLRTLLERNDLPALRILIIEIEPKRLRLRMQQLDMLRFITLCTSKGKECIVVENLRHGTFLRSSSLDLRLWKQIRRPGWRQLLEM
ncbi:hypothetical protein KVT40_000750 [Elsinoe batatas]|uniref:Uncharacterized protein n=1 Tax=Elsinoe batatas TaxID=2601811 RepID=A0A8K0LA72_9PEZI|nr:hypothetical protein KVT40_000750 [Elsinoe batatas]